jgi:hypothetical protein
MVGHPTRRNRRGLSLSHYRHPTPSAANGTSTSLSPPPHPYIPGGRERLYILLDPPFSVRCRSSKVSFIGDMLCWNDLGNLSLSLLRTTMTPTTYGKY